MTSLGAIPFATMINREWGTMGQNYLRAMLALGFQAFLIMVCVGIYAVLVQSIATDTDIMGAVWTCVGQKALKSWSLQKGFGIYIRIFLIKQEKLFLTRNFLRAVSPMLPAIFQSS